MVFRKICSASPKLLIIQILTLFNKRPVQVNLFDDKIETNARHDQFRLAYAELLYHWGLTETRAELLKFMKFVKTTVGSPLGERQDPLGINNAMH